MTWRKIVLGSAFCLSCLCGSAQEHFNFNGSTLREYCKLAESDSSKLSGDDLDHAIICTYYVNGVLDGYEAGVEPAKSLICSPDTVTRGQKVLIVAKYLEDHPEMLHNDPRFLILDALSKAFPCKSKPTR
jgi:hypothetical protein